MAELTRGQKAARTRAKNKAARANAVEKVTIRGLTTDTLGGIIASLDSAYDNMIQYASLTRASVTLDVNGIEVNASHDGSNWTISLTS